MGIPHLIVFKDANWQGDHLHIFNNMESLPKDFDNEISSFVVLSGRWRFYDYENFEVPLGHEFTIGMYNFEKRPGEEVMESLRKHKAEMEENDEEFIEVDFKDRVLPEDAEVKADEDEEDWEEVEINDKISSIQLVGMW